MAGDAGKAGGAGKLSPHLSYPSDLPYPPDFGRLIGGTIPFTR